MFREILETTTSLLRLSQDLQETREEVKDIRAELRDLTLVVERLRMEVQQVAEREARERQMIMLQLENVLLRERPQLALPVPDGG